MNVQYMDAVDIKDDSAEYGDMFYWDVDSSTVQAAVDKYTRSGLRNVSASSPEISPPCKKKNHLPELPSLPAANSNKEHIYGRWPKRRSSHQGKTVDIGRFPTEITGKIQNEAGDQRIYR
ncbi:hypothetical protein B0H13DRAFT_1853257 [Mycena leptocephala]|nr:hypothetical protein B0H13DRAFT_1853257 [Mycena leptocephala]